MLFVLHVAFQVLLRSCMIRMLSPYQAILELMADKCLSVLIDDMDHTFLACLDLHPSRFQATLSFPFGSFHHRQRSALYQCLRSVKRKFPCYAEQKDS